MRRSPGKHEYICVNNMHLYNTLRNNPHTIQYHCRVDNVLSEYYKNDNKLMEFNITIIFLGH